jgi:hypothetical protein
LEEPEVDVEEGEEEAVLMESGEDALEEPEVDVDEGEEEAVLMESGEDALEEPEVDLEEGEIDIFPFRITFFDPNLEEAVRRAINKPTGDIRPTDVAALEELHAWYIENLSGLDVNDGINVKHFLGRYKCEAPLVDSWFAGAWGLGGTQEETGSVSRHGAMEGYPVPGASGGCKHPGDTAGDRTSFQHGQEDCGESRAAALQPTGMGEAEDRSVPGSHRRHFMGG